MEGEGVEEGRSREVESIIMDNVGRVIGSINEAKHVDQVILSLHSLAILLFPLDSRAFSGSIDKLYRDEVLSAKVPSVEERQNWWEVFYGGASFPTMSRVLLYDITSNWLACFPISARKHVYDVFFVSGRATEVVQTLVPSLQQNGNDKFGNSPVCSNAERLVTLCLLENDGVLHMAREFGGSCQPEGLWNEQCKLDISRVAQLVTSIPDKARLGAPKSLLSHLFFKQITIQLLAGAEEDRNLCNGAATLHKSEMDRSIAFVGEAFARICRRGSADVLLSELAPRILKYVRSFLLPKTDLTVSEEFESMLGSGFWSKMMEAIKDPYAVERMSEQLLHCLATQDISDAEAYWILWILFHRSYERQTSVRSMFVEKFLFWKVFPICCLRWILQFAVLECPPDAASLTKGHSKRGLLGTVQQLVAVWSKREFVQSAPVEQQAYVTAAVGLSLEQMSKEDLDATKGAMHSILQGVSCRLESPSHLVRKMASCVALVFSKVIDPKNPLYLDDLCPEETVDWEFGIVTSERSTLAISRGMGTDIDQVAGCSTTLVPEKELNNTSSVEMGNILKDGKKKISEFNLVDPDEVIDPAMLNKELISDEEDYDDDASKNSETSSNSSLQPYDLIDDDTDLKRNFSQLVDVIGALRKSDNADGIEKALNVSEKLIRASPDELKYVAGDLSRTLVQVRCFDSTIEGEEESAEEKRQKALVALIVTSPLECLDTLNKLLYSPNVDVSQRIMILDVMTEAAQELAHATTTKPKALSRAQISTISETQPWFMPSSIGPPGVGAWREISGTGTPLNWSYSYERTLPSIPGQIKKGKSRRWSLRTENIQEHQLEWSQNRFPQYAAAFMLPSMQGFDKKRHGVDLLGGDFLVLGRLVYMLGVCMKCAAMHPEASALVLPLMDMLSSRDLCYHVEAYVRRSVLFAASCILVALHPSYVASALVEGNPEISKGLEWIRTWALSVAESDTDRECYTMAMACLQLHAEMALQASRAIESAENTSKANSFGEECKTFFQTLYKFVFLLGTYLKPHVAILDGMTLGAGAGVSLPGMFRVVTDRTAFATPEAQIGFHPDAGASFYLSRLPGYLGEYLALTGQKLNGVEMVACGLATHYSLKERLPLIDERLSKLMTDDTSVIENSLAQYGDLVYPDKSSILNKIKRIDKCFSQDTVEEIMNALENEAAESYDEWSMTTLKKLKEASPLSLKVTLQSIREGRYQPLDRCLAREYRMSLNWISKKVSNDFCEGVRARLVDKDFTPKWDPPTLREVTKDMVDCYFSPLAEVEPGLNLNSAKREPSV